MKTSALAVLLAFAAHATAAQDASTQTLITNVDVFDGINETLIEGASVLIDDNLIAAVSTDPI